MINGFRRMLALLLACALSFGTLLPAVAYAEEVGTEVQVIAEDFAGDNVLPPEDQNQADACAEGHSWEDADCITPKTCTVCGTAEGEPLGHDWTDADCSAAKHCTVCGTTEGEALGHSWEEAEGVNVCAVCGSEAEIQQAEQIEQTEPVTAEKVEAVDSEKIDVTEE